MQKNKFIKFYEAINQALITSMKKDKKMICYGLGVTDPKEIFSTTINLKNFFGKERVFDVPCSENALTGISIGAALNGVRSVVSHQRVDFFMLAMDQLVNSASKWHYMFGSKKSVPITIRLIIGRGWGQGPTHSQNLQALFNHIPGLKIVAPTFPSDAREMLKESIFDPNPVLFLEHRWLFDLKEKNKTGINKIGKARLVKKGKDITVVSFSYLTIESIKASRFLSKNYNISVEIIDLISLKPIDYKRIYTSLKKTNNILILDTGFNTGSIANDIIYNVIQSNIKLKSKPQKLAMPDVPEPTSYGLTKNFYIDDSKIISQILDSLKIKKKFFLNIEEKQNYHDVPGEWFKGPF
tara:strand:+ start:4198 stop:5256 length:1059 start_codon:yes stop_codon:yes gene_type:complete